MEQNQGLQKHEYGLSVISEKERFELAILSRKIKDSSEEEIRQVLRYAMVKIGLRGANFPVNLEKVLLINHVRQNFHDNTVEEIKIAFDWAIQGRLKVEVNCYENFSCLYFTNIMNAYNALKSNVEKEREYIVVYDEKKEEVIEDPEAFNKFMETGFAQTLQGLGINIPKW